MQCFIAVLCWQQTHRVCEEERCECSCHNTYTSPLEQNTLTFEQGLVQLAYEVWNSQVPMIDIPDVIEKHYKARKHTPIASELDDLVTVIKIVRNKRQWSWTSTSELLKARDNGQPTLF